jgi:hypothetical protein
VLVGMVDISSLRVYHPLSGCYVGGLGHLSRWIHADNARVGRLSLSAFSFSTFLPMSRSSSMPTC